MSPTFSIFYTLSISNNLLHCSSFIYKDIKISGFCILIGQKVLISFLYNTLVWVIRSSPNLLRTFYKLGLLVWGKNNNWHYILNVWTVCKDKETFTACTPLKSSCASQELSTSGIDSWKKDDRDRSIFASLVPVPSLEKWEVCARKGIWHENLCQ